MAIAYNFTLIFGHLFHLIIEQYTALFSSAYVTRYGKTDHLHEFAGRGSEVDKIFFFSPYCESMAHSHTMLFDRCYAREKEGTPDLASYVNGLTHVQCFLLYDRYGPCIE